MKEALTNKEMFSKLSFNMTFDDKTIKAFAEKCVENNKKMLEKMR